MMHGSRADRNERNSSDEINCSVVGPFQILISSILDAITATDETSCPTFRVFGNREIRAAAKKAIKCIRLLVASLVSLPIIHSRMMAHLQGKS